MTPSQRVARSYMASVDAALEPEVSRAVRDHMLKYLREMKTAYRRMYNSQKVEGRVFESLLEGSIPNYEALTRGGEGLDPSWIPYVGNADYPREDLPLVRELARKAVFSVLNELFGDAVGMSSSYHWDTETEEEFWFLTHGYDVREAKRIIVSRPRVVETLGVDTFRGMASRTLGMNPEDASVDLRLPVLVATTKGGNYLPIDGWNRIRKALRQGDMTVPAVFLNATETKRISF